MEKKYGYPYMRLSTKMRYVHLLRRAAAPGNAEQGTAFGHPRLLPKDSFGQA